MPQNEELAQLPLNSAGSAYEATRPLSQQDLREYQWKTASINLRSGMSGYLSGSKGYFIGFSKGVLGVTNGTPVFSVGNPAGDYVAWDGTTLKIVGNVTVTGGTVTGSLTVSTGGYFNSGQTAYNTGTGWWMEYNAGSPRISFGDAAGSHFTFDAVNGFQIYNSSDQLIFGQAGIDLSTATPGTTGAGIINVDTNYIGDSQGWHNTGVWGQVSSTPTTRGGYNITDAQETLPNASAIGQVLYRDNGGAPYFADKYGTEFNSGWQGFSTVTFTATTFTQIGNTINIPNPGQDVSLYVYGGLSCEQSGTITVPYQFVCAVQFSIDGGVSWAGSNSQYCYFPSTSLQINFMEASVTENVSPTADIQLRLVGELVAGSGGTVTLRSPFLGFQISPLGNYSVITGAVTATIPSTVSGNCSAYYPTTTCTTTNSVMVTPNGGTPPYTYSWTKVSGTGTLSNTTSQTVTITDTETTTDAGASFNTVVKCTVTDSALSSATSGNCTATNTFTRLYNPVSVTTSNTSPNYCFAASCGTTCTTSATATANASGGDGSYSYSWTRVSGTGTITNATSQTCTVTDTEATANPYALFSTVVKCTVTDGHGLTANSSTTVDLKFKCTV